MCIRDRDRYYSVRSLFTSCVYHGLNRPSWEAEAAQTQSLWFLFGSLWTGVSLVPVWLTVDWSLSGSCLAHCGLESLWILFGSLWTGVSLDPVWLTVDWSLSGYCLAHCGLEPLWLLFGSLWTGVSIVTVWLTVDWLMPTS